MQSSIGVEIGGTFTDLVSLDHRGIRIAKVPSTPSDPAEGALRAMAETHDDFGAIATVVHGSTVATNAVLERRGTRVAFLVTSGFEDMLELQRQDRSDPLRLKYTKPHPIVAREDVFGVTERLSWDGAVLVAPVEEEIVQILDDIAARGIHSIAVCLLHSYRNPDHELIVERIAAETHPELVVALSHLISPEPREYERASTAALDAYVRPAVNGYLGAFQEHLEASGFTGDLHVMQSNGGALPADLLRRNAVRMLLSGPAGGVAAAIAVSSELGIGNILTFDMGGTSSDICLIQEGRAEVRQDSEIDGLPIRVPMLDILTVGSGGGSLANVDLGGMVHVGPRSSGAEPGPACYGRGGVQATITDANVAVGIIRPDTFLGGAMPLDVSAAESACERIGAQLGTDAQGGAVAIRRIATTDLTAALRLASTERGIDPGEFWLLTYGGAGAQMAVPLAEELGLRGVIVPIVPGLFSAYGLVTADLTRDWSSPVLADLSVFSARAFDERCASLIARAYEDLEDAGVETSSTIVQRRIGVRYRGQSDDLEIDLAAGERFDAAEIAERFHHEHRTRFGHGSPETPVEIVAVRVLVTVPRSHGEEVSFETPRFADAPRRVEYIDRPALDDEGPVAYVDRRAIEGEVHGPAVIEEETSTTWIPRGWRANPAGHGHLVIERTEH